MPYLVGSSSGGSINYKKYYILLDQDGGSRDLVTAMPLETRTINGGSSESGPDSRSAEQAMLKT
jgi:hypothetical protein